ncbi:hypothetical protein HHI36_016451 [Cryptolaemus montrouzieri]|uniref:BRCT domain-containing protein n=1 Tax=Cryptolaemus montrouzieri TaxID=559131 RepID=A0ABD2NJQ1_9CUCU
MDSISVIFVLSDGLKDESEAGEIMIQAYEACKQNKVNTHWIKERDLSEAELKKTDFIVFENFEGKDFDYIKEKKSAILGPWCLLICLMEGKKIPNFQWPIHNIAMYNCIVTTSHLSKSAKMEICEKVQKMGGYYTDDLRENTTHLVTDSVETKKYMKAIEMNVKVMTSPWIDAVWEASQETNVHCDDSQFSTFKCPPFHKLIICSTGITSSTEREEVRKLVLENGGEFSGKLNLNNTNFLICEGMRGTMSEKYKQARKTENVHCVTIRWLHDSIEKGYCVPHENYSVKKGTSTPIKGDQINPDFSTMSAIDQSKCEGTSVDETMLPKSSISFLPPSSGVKRKTFSDCDNLIEQIDIKRAKRSGQFLDGCSVYLVGFKGNHREKLCKVINVSGATRCDDMSDRVTHVIVGDPECHEVKIIRSKGYSCCLITLHWLLDSIERRRPCNEEPYLVNTGMNESHFRSPLGKKGLNLLRSNRTITEVDFTSSQSRPKDQDYRIPETTEEDTLANLLKNADYDSKNLRSQESQDAPSGSASQLTLTPESQPLQIFQGLKFLITGYDEEQIAELREKIDEGVGTVTNNIKEANYVVSPTYITEPLAYDKDITVSDIWLYESISEEELLEIKYYHRPLLIASTTVLEDCVVTISGHSGYERNFLMSLIEHLGGTCQEQFCRVTSVERNVLGSTHLVTAEASGKKYAAALKWRLPAVSKDWLIACATEGRKLPENEFLVSEKTPQDESSSNSRDKVDSNKENISNDKVKIPENMGNTASESSKTALENTSRKSSPRSSMQCSIEVPGDTVSVASCSKPLMQVDSHADRITISEADISIRKEDSYGDDSFTIPRSNRLCRDQKTPSNKTPFGTQGHRPDEGYSPVTPVDKIMKEVRKTNLLGTPESPQLASAPWDVNTPESPYGAYIDPNPSKSLKKEMLRFLNQFPDRVAPPPRRLSTPLSELKRRLWAKIGTCADSPSQIETQDETSNQEEEHETEQECETQSALVNTRLQQLENLMVAASGSGNRSRRQSRATAFPGYASEVDLRESQPCTVQWDYGMDTQKELLPPKVFMISGISSMETRAEIVTHLESLGATVSETSSYDPDSTHLLCPKPSRNEKTLSCMAAGKWILHTNYVDACLKAGKFLDEEEYEFGNPNSIGKISIELDRDIEIRMQAIHYWRNEIARSGRGPFYDMRAIVVAEKKQALISVIEAGGGTVIDAEPPFDDVVHATHCLIEIKSAAKFALYEPLAQQGIYCVNTVYISDFLHRTNKDIKDCILPFYHKYFK